MKSIWQNLPEKSTILAPMEGVTDIVFRQVVAHASRPDLYFTEFTNVSSFASEKGRPNALERLAIAPSDPPIIAQIWGKTPKHFAYTAEHLPEGFAGIDINMGCPDRHVVANGGGAALIKSNPALSADLISATKSHTSLPVSVKTRLGYSKADEWKPWLTHLLSQDISALTVHLRTKKEMSEAPAHFDLMSEILALRDDIAPETTIIFNGDFNSRIHFDTILSHYDIPGNPYAIPVMIGRGVFADPFCFEENIKVHSREDLLALLVLHLDLFDAHHENNPNPPFQPLKRFFKIYINNFPGASDLRTLLMETTNTAEVRALLSRV